jgi:hydrogenase maturation protease
MKRLVLGIGNLLLGDEGVGIHVVRALEGMELPPDTDVLDGGTGGLHLIGLLEGYERIVMVDATLDEQPAGTVRHLKPRYASDFPTLMSAHEIGLRDMIAAMHLTGHVPDIDLLVVSVNDVSRLGIGLSRPVAEAIPEVIRRIWLLLT